MAQLAPSGPFRLFLLLALLFALSACGSSLPPERTLELTVTAEGYDQPRLEAMAGEMVTIRLRNRDSVAHNLNLELPSGRRTISADSGVDATVSFPAREAGTIRFFCNVPGHTETGLLVIK